MESSRLTSDNNQITVMVIAGETSGDLLASEVMQELKLRHSNVKFVGVGGDKMKQAGLDSAFPMNELSLMGLAEVLPHIPNLLKRGEQLKKLAKDSDVNLLLTVDSPDFCLRVAKKIKKSLNIPCIHYVSPSIWAWRKGRAGKMAKYLDHVLALFPFEPDLYDKYGLKCSFVGHPVAKRLESLAPKKLIPPSIGEEVRIALVPGSRQGEIVRCLPHMLQAFDRLKREYSNIRAVLPLASVDHSTWVNEIMGKRDDVDVIIGDDRFNLLPKCRASIATSGTVNLELAMLGLPTVVVYKMANSTYKLARMLVNVPYISPVNWVAGEIVMPELIQQDVTSENITKTVRPWLKNDSSYMQIAEELSTVRAKLGCGSDEVPAVKCADIIDQYIYSHSN